MANQDFCDRTRRLLGDENMQRLSSLRVIIFGIGGVGSWCAEALIRSGLQHLTIVDADTVSVTNINRQAMATSSNVGKSKVEEMRQRLLDINPEADIVAINGVYDETTADSYDLNSYDYVVDAIDSLKDKALLILRATAAHTTLFSSMGAALKLDPQRIHVAEFYKVKGCPLAAALRRRFKRMDRYPRRKFKCVYSDELVPNLGATIDDTADGLFRKACVNGSMMHITAIFGLTLAAMIISPKSAK